MAEDEVFEREEIADLRELLDKVQDVAEGEVVASLIGYNGQKVILAKPFAVEQEIREALEEKKASIDGED